MKSMSKQQIIRIAIPVVILLIIGGIWVMKHSASKEVTNAVSSSTAQAQGDSPVATVKGDTAQNASADYDMEVTGVIDLAALKAYGQPILIDYGTDSCPPCVIMEPALKSVNAATKGRAFVKVVDLGDHPEAAENYPIRVTPTQVLFDKTGKPYSPPADSDLKFTTYNDKATGEHVLTVHEGALSQDQLETLLTDMGMAAND